MFFDKVPTITSDQLKKIIQEKRNINIIDVREPFEFKQGHIPGSINIPLDNIKNVQDNFKNNVYVVCHSGHRSNVATKYLIKKGIHAFSLKDGLLNWHGELINS